MSSELINKLKKKDMLIDNTNDKVASEEEKAIWKILEAYGVNPVLQPKCGDEIIELVNKLSINVVMQPEPEQVCHCCGSDLSGAVSLCRECIDDI